MNDNKGYRIWQWAVLLLVLCNIGLIITLCLKPHHGPPEGVGGPRDQVISSLKFTSDQVKKYDLLIEGHQGKMRQLRGSGAKLRQALFSNLSTGGPGGFADSLSREIGKNQQEIELATYDHFSQVRALCDDRQKQEFDKIIVDITRNMNGGPGGHRPPPGGGRPEGGPGRPPEEAGPPPPSGDPGGERPPPPDGH